MVYFCYQDNLDVLNLRTQNQTLDYLRGASREFLEAHTVGIDQGVVRPVQAENEVFDLTLPQKRKKKEAYLKRCQRRLSRQKKDIMRGILLNHGHHRGKEGEMDFLLAEETVVTSKKHTEAGKVW